MNTSPLISTGWTWGGYSFYVGRRQLKWRYRRLEAARLRTKLVASSVVFRQGREVASFPTGQWLLLGLAQPWWGVGRCHKSTVLHQIPALFQNLPRSPPALKGVTCAVCIALIETQMYSSTYPLQTFMFFSSSGIHSLFICTVTAWLHLYTHTIHSYTDVHACHILSEGF